MAKRFTDSTKWNNKFLRSLKAPYKILWLYILDECDHAGIWQIDMEVARLKIGEKVILSDAIKFFGNRIIVLQNEEKMFIPDFIEFQYGNLNPANKVHESIIKILSKYDLLDENNKIKAHTSPLQGAKDKDKEKEMDKDKEEGKQKIEIEKTEFEKAFCNFLEMRNKIKKPATDKAIELIMGELHKLAPDNEELKIEILNQSTRNNWQDVYQLKNKSQNGKTTFEEKVQGMNSTAAMALQLITQKEFDNEHGN